MSIPFYVYNKEEQQKSSKTIQRFVKVKKIKLKLKDENEMIFNKLCKKYEFSEKEKNYIIKNLANIKFMNIMIILLAFNLKKLAKSGDHKIKSKKNIIFLLEKYFSESLGSERFEEYLKKKKCTDKENELRYETIAFELKIYLNIMKDFD